MPKMKKNTRPSDMAMPAMSAIVKRLFGRAKTKRDDRNVPARTTAWWAPRMPAVERREALLGTSNDSNVLLGRKPTPNDEVLHPSGCRRGHATLALRPTCAALRARALRRLSWDEGCRTSKCSMPYEACAGS